MTQNALQKKQHSIKTLMDRPDVQEKISSVMASNMDARKITQVALLSINKTPKLAECSIPSLLQCIMDSAKLGLEPDGREAHLIPYGAVCQFQPDWKGIGKLLRQSGEIRYFNTSVVYQNDEFRVVKGAKPDLIHEPATSNRGEAIGAYSIVVFNNGFIDPEWMEKDEIESIRKGSPSANSPAWKNTWGEMARKVVFKRHSKRLPLGSPEQQRTLDNVIDRETGYASTAATSYSDSDVMTIDAEAEETTDTAPEQQKPAQEDSKPEEGADDQPDRKALLTQIYQATKDNEGGYKAASQEWGLDRRKADPFADIPTEDLPRLLADIKNM